MRMVRVNWRIFQFLLLSLCFILSYSPSHLVFAQAELIYQSNNKAVATVEILDEKGDVLTQGSGFIIREDGAVVTNYHVLSTAGTVRVKANHALFNVEKVLFLNVPDDILILKVNSDNLPTVKIGDSDKIKEGDKIFVISSPLGFDNTISEGILSGRRVFEGKSVLQFTAPVSPGSSGGPIFNEKGEVIGIVRFLIRGGQNLNFGIPVNLLRDKSTAEGWFWIGNFYYQDQNWKEAVNAYRRAIERKPDFAYAHNYLGLALTKLGQYKEAIDAYKQAIKIRQDFTGALSNLGSTYLTTGDTVSALQIYNTLRDLDTSLADQLRNQINK